MKAEGLITPTGKGRAAKWNKRGRAAKVLSSDILSLIVDRSCCP